MKSKLLAAAIGGIVLAGMSALASAATITYSTSGIFNASSSTTGGITGDGTDSLTDAGGITLTYLALPPSSVEAPPPTNASLGTFQLSGDGLSSFTSNFILTIDQSAPTSGTGDLSASVDATFVYADPSGPDSAYASVTFSTPSVTIGDVTYTLSSNPVYLVPPDSNDGQTTIEAIVATSVPTPAAALSGSALLAAMFAARAKSRRRMY